MAGVIDRFRAMVRGALGLPADPGEPPELMRLGLYRARVDAAASDGSTLDLTPEDKRISPEKGVPVRVGVPGAVAVVQTGAVVLLGWERGDPGKPYAVPAWEPGAGITSLAFGSSADGVATKRDLQILFAAIHDAATTANDGGAAFKAAILLSLGNAGWSSALTDGKFTSGVVKVQR